jgi:hypothetical protein
VDQATDAVPDDFLPQDTLIAALSVAVSNRFTTSHCPFRKRGGDLQTAERSWFLTSAFLAGCA